MRKTVWAMIIGMTLLTGAVAASNDEATTTTTTKAVTAAPMAVVRPATTAPPMCKAKTVENKTVEKLYTPIGGFTPVKTLTAHGPNMPPDPWEPTCPTDCCAWYDLACIIFCGCGTGSTQ
jgi:hypothetical protein